MNNTDDPETKMFLATVPDERDENTIDRHNREKGWPEPRECTSDWQNVTEATNHVGSGFLSSAEKMESRMGRVGVSPPGGAFKQAETGLPW